MRGRIGVGSKILFVENVFEEKGWILNWGREGEDQN